MSISLVDVTPENIMEQGIYCILDTKAAGFKAKRNWFEERYEDGLRMKLLRGDSKRPIGFIEYIPANNAWRPVEADGFIFIHCVMVYPNKNKSKGYGSILIKACEKDAKSESMAGVCVMTSDGSWVAGKELFAKNKYSITDKLGRFELLSKKWDSSKKDPKLIDWTKKQKKYAGWNLLYAAQCPWHEKAVEAIEETARKEGIQIKVNKIKTAQEARQGPSGFGVFSLIKDGKLLEDHYISATRFKSILKKETGV